MRTENLILIITLVFFSVINEKIYAQNNQSEKIEVIETLTEYYIDNELIGFLTLEIRNVSNNDILLWIDKENNKNLSLNEIIKNHFIKIKGDFSLFQVAIEAGGTLDFIAFELFSSFVKILNPETVFKIIIPYEDELMLSEIKSNNIKDLIITVEEKDVEKYFKIAMFRNINYNSDVLYIPAKSIFNVKTFE